MSQAKQSLGYTERRAFAFAIYRVEGGAREYVLY